MKNIDPNSLIASDNAIITSITTKKVFDYNSVVIREELVAYTVSLKPGYDDCDRISISYTELTKVN